MAPSKAAPLRLTTMPSQQEIPVCVLHVVMFIGRRLPVTPCSLAWIFNRDLAPSFSTWIDLGYWWALNTQCGVEHALESNDSELFCRASVIHTLAPHDDHDGGDAGHDHAHGLPPGLLSLILEVDMALPVSGPDDGDIEAEGIAGLYSGLSEHADLRLGYAFPLSTSQDLYRGLTAGLLWHF